MLDTNHCLSFEPSSSECSPIGEDFEKAALKMDLDRHVYHSLKEGGLELPQALDTWSHLCLCPSYHCFTAAYK